MSLVNHIANYLGTDDCVFYATQGDQLIQVAATNKKLDINQSVKKAFQLELGKGIVGNVALSKKGVIVADTRKNKDYIIDDQTRLSEITVPILLDDKLIGIIDAEHLDKNYFNENQLAVLKRFSNSIGIH